MTECIQSDFKFEAAGRREIVARFDGGTISSDGGAFLLRQTDQRLNLLPRLAECFLDGRNQEQVEHSILEMLSQRIYGLALGYEDLNDHEQLRQDPVFGILAGRELEKPLAGKSTLNRMELGSGAPDRYKKITFWKEAIDELLVKVFIESQSKAPDQLVLDVDTTDLPLHGKQEGRFFHGYYDSYCYLPLYIFCGEHVLCARLREANHDAAFGSLAEIRRIVAQMRAAWRATESKTGLTSPGELEIRRRMSLIAFCCSSECFNWWRSFATSSLESILFDAAGARLRLPGGLRAATGRRACFTRFSTICVRPEQLKTRNVSNASQSRSARTGRARRDSGIAGRRGWNRGRRGFFSTPRNKTWQCSGKSKTAFGKPS